MNVSQSDIFCNCAITFITPPYDNRHYNGTVNGEDIKVYICVVIGNTTYQSNCVKFYYVTENNNRPYVEVDNESRPHTIRPNVIVRDRLHINDRNLTEQSEIDKISDMVAEGDITALPLDKLKIVERKVTVQDGIDNINDMVAKGDETDLGKSQLQDTQYYFFSFTFLGNI